MSQILSQDFSYHYLVDPTPDDLFAEADYLDPANAETIYRRTAYPFESVQDDLSRLFPSAPPKNWAERYFHWWMEQKKTGVIEADPYFYNAIDPEQWNGDWSTGENDPTEAVRLVFGKKSRWLKKEEFEQVLSEKGFFPLGGHEIDSWDQMLEIAATAPSPLGKISIGPPVVATEEKAALYRRLSTGKMCRLADGPQKEFRSASLPQAELSFLFQVDKAARLKLPVGGGWAALDYKEGAEIQAHFKLESGRPTMANGTALMSFKGVSVSLRPEQLIDLASRQYGIQISRQASAVLDALIEATKDYYRIPVRGISVFGGRPCLELYLSAHPWIGGLWPYPLFVELSLAADSGLPPPEGLFGDILGDPSFRLQSDLNSGLLLKTAEEMLHAARQGIDDGGMISSLIPPSYQGVFWLRSLKGSAVLESPDLLFGEEVQIDDGVLRIDFNSQGAHSAEGRLPVYFLRNAGNEESRTLSAEFDFRIKNNENGRYEGWIEARSDELPALIGSRFTAAKADIFFSDVLFNPDAMGLNDLLTQMINEFEVQLIRDGNNSVLIQGGGIYAQEDSQVYVSGNGNVLSLLPVPVGRNDVAVSWNGMRGIHEKNFEFSGFSFELVDGLEFEIRDVVGTYRKNSDETVLNVKGIFRFTADGPFIAEKSVLYEGKIVWDPKKQTMTLVNLDMPLADLALNFRQGEEKFPFVFSGRLTGQLRVDLRRGTVAGPFALSGDLWYIEDARESGIPVLPRGLRVADPFSARIPFHGVVCRPAEQTELKTAADVIQENRHSSRVQAVEGIVFQVNSLSRQSNGVVADLLIEMDEVLLVSPAPDLPGGSTTLQPLEPQSGAKSPPFGGKSETGADFPKPLVVHSARMTLDDWDIYLEPYGLDREKAEIMLNMIRNSEEANFSLTGFKVNRTGSPLLQVPANAFPQVDVRVVNGRVERFHLYFSQPIGIPPLVRGVYFDKRTGKFRLDLINNRDEKRPPDFYRISRDDPGITKTLFRMLPLPEEVVDHLLAESTMNPDFVTSDASVWLEFILLMLAAFAEDSLQKLEPPQKSGYPVEMDQAKVTIRSLRLKPETVLSMYGARFDIGCNHDAMGDGDVNHGDNLLSGTIDFGEGVFRLRMDNVDKLHIFVPGGEGRPPLMDLMLRDGEIGVLEMRRDDKAAILKISGMRFAQSRLTGKPFEENLDLRVISNFRMNEMEIRRESEDIDRTTITTDFSADLEAGHLHFRKGTQEAHFEIGPSPLQVKSSIRFEDVVREGPKNKWNLGFNREIDWPIVDTVLTASEFEVTSKELVYSRVSLAPGIVFDRSVTRDARIVLKSGEGGEGELLNLTGNFDWRMNQPFPVPLARIQLIPRLIPALQFDSMSLSGPGQLLFADNKVFFGEIREDEKVPTALREGALRVNYSGNLSVEHVPIAGRPEYVTRLSGRFEGSHKYREGQFFLDESSEDFPLHVEEMTAEDIVINIRDLNGTVYTESASPTGVSAYSFVDGTGLFSSAEVHLQEGGWAKFADTQLQLYDNGPHRNVVAIKGDMEVKNKVFTFEDLDLEGELYDELNKIRMKGIKIRSHPPVTWLWQEPWSEPPYQAVDKGPSASLPAFGHSLRRTF